MLIETYIHIYIYIFPVMTSSFLHFCPISQLCVWPVFFFKITRSVHNFCMHCKSYCNTVHFSRIASIYQPTNAHIISHKTHLKHFKTLRHVSILSDHHQGALFLATVALQYSQFNSYLQTRCCGSISCRTKHCHCPTTHSHTT